MPRTIEKPSAQMASNAGTGRGRRRGRCTASPAHRNGASRAFKYHQLLSITGSAKYAPVRMTTADQEKKGRSIRRPCHANQGNKIAGTTVILPRRVSAPEVSSQKRLTVSQGG